MDVHPEARRRMRKNATTDTARQETAGDHDDKRRRVDEPESPISPVAQNEAPILNPVPFDMETKNDEIAADAPFPEEPAEVSGENDEGWITEKAFFTVSPGARRLTW